MPTLGAAAVAFGVPPDSVSYIGLEPTSMLATSPIHPRPRGKTRAVAKCPGGEPILRRTISQAV